MFKNLTAIIAGTLMALATGPASPKVDIFHSAVGGTTFLGGYVILVK